MTKAEKSLLSEVITILQIILVMPATNAVSERSFSALKRIKDYLRSMMLQGRLNNSMLLHIHEDEFDIMDLIQIANTFGSKNKSRNNMFGTFTNNDKSQKKDFRSVGVHTAV